VVETNLSVEDALANRDGLAKAIYARLFQWMVKRVNKTIAVKNKKVKRCTIATLDIYGEMRLTMMIKWNSSVTMLTLGWTRL
jgi:myosin heavy subunit